MLWVPTHVPFQLKAPGPQILGCCCWRLTAEYLPQESPLSAGATLPETMTPSWITPALRTCQFRNPKPWPPCLTIGTTLRDHASFSGLHRIWALRDHLLMCHLPLTTHPFPLSTSILNSCGCISPNRILPECESASGCVSREADTQDRQADKDEWKWKGG